MFSFSIKSDVCSTYGVARYWLYFLTHFSNEVKVYLDVDFTSTGEMLCRVVMEGFLTRKSISIRSAAVREGLEKKYNSFLNQ